MNRNIQSVVHVSREYGEFIGAGGVKISTKGVCMASSKSGIKTHIFIPYPRRESEVAKLSQVGPALSFDVGMNPGKRCRHTEQVSVHSYIEPGKPNLVLHFVASRRFDYLPDGDGAVRRRGVYTYTSDEASMIGRPDLAGNSYRDNFELNTLLAKSALRAMELMNLRCDLIHCHDGHTGLLPLIAQYSEDNYAPFLRLIPTLTTIHNAANRYRGEIQYGKFVESITGVPKYILKSCLHNRQFDPVVAAALFGTELNTVSQNYARELQETSLDWTTGWLGHKLAGYGIIIKGITNGVDPASYNPEFAEQMGIAASFSPVNNDFEGKRVCKKVLIDKLGLKSKSHDTPLLTFVGRLVHQKGLDILADSIRKLFVEDEDIQLIVIGDNGGGEIVELLKTLEAKFDNRIRVFSSYDDTLANQIFAAGDFCIIPSRFEPCGVVDLIAQLFGNIPIVHSVGGLVKVCDGETGLSYRGGAEELLNRIKEAVELYRRKRDVLRQIQLNAVSNIYRNYTWDAVFNNQYIPLYREVIKKAAPVLF
jgi:starch synthase